ncbi:PH-interacting protein-like isoform X3 [Bombina bombina]|uniref:PH-interacting protein-like isoform X3 n=1 Tax=Bombina bombina TaxID=8345 RepID=UPI00235AB815|nr:PH-interacting protein-like isoform X3 [Bombina bombina]
MNGKVAELTSLGRTRSNRRQGEPNLASQPSTSSTFKPLSAKHNNSLMLTKSVPENTIKSVKSQTIATNPLQPTTSTLIKNSVSKENPEKDKAIKRKIKILNGAPQAVKKDVSVPETIHVNGHSNQPTKPVAKGRPGRKPKIIVNNNDNIAKNSVPPLIPKKRGRKPKYIRTEEQQNSSKLIVPFTKVKEQPTTSTGNVHVKQEVKNENEVPKKRRGRKPKVKTEATMTTAPPVPPPAEPEHIDLGIVKIQTRSKCKKSEEPMDELVDVSDDPNLSETQMRTRNQGRRTAFYNEEDSEEEQRQLLFEDTSLTFGTSSRGRVRKLTEKAKANLIGW